ncbi:hypothetical protein BZL39_A02660 [Zygosaccharomyces parabailii]|nr:hypothetical protein BZL39_A02660 [Zygosaccharomyces parabailii]CDH12954.1 uncharacterized protein ZBAI_04740 [Zygosaccharomyces bailii ISA1307]
MTKRRKANYHSRGKRRKSSRNNVRPSSRKLTSPRRLAVPGDVNSTHVEATGQTTRTATQIFRNPLITKDSLSHIKDYVGVFKPENFSDIQKYFHFSRESFSHAKLISPLLFGLYGTLGFFYGRQDNVSFVFVYTVPIIHALRQLIEYLNDADAIRSSIFDWGDKTYAEYFISPLLTEVVLLIIDVAGFIYHLVIGKQTPSIFGFGLSAYVNYLVVNIELAFHKSQQGQTDAESLP